MYSLVALVLGCSYGKEARGLLRHTGEREPAAFQGGDGKQSRVPFFSLLCVYLLVVYIYDVFASYFTLNS